MKKLKLISLLSLVVFALPLALFAQVEEDHRLNEFVGEYTYSVSIDQPGIKSFSFGKAKIQLTENNTINSEFSNHDIEFVIEYNPPKKIYFFTYVFKQSEFNRNTKEPLLSINKVELVYSEDTGYMGKETNEEKDWNIEVTIKVEESKIDCKVRLLIEKKTFEHNVSLF